MKDSTYDGEVLNVSDLVQYYYCPRKVYFLKVMGVPFKPRKKMTFGKDEQKREKKRVTERKDVFGLPREELDQILRKVHILNPIIGLYGQIDVVLKHKNGELLPVDIKYSDFVQVARHWKKQLTAYAMLLDFKFDTTVRKGILYFPKQKEHLGVGITEEDKKFVLRDLETIRELIRTEIVPRKVDESKCRYCEVAKYCV